MADKLLTRAEFCERFRLSRSTFYNLKSANDLPPLHAIGGRYLITEQDAEDWWRSKAA